MPRNSNEKGLGADLDSQLVDEFRKQVENRGVTMKRALTAAVELWLSLPYEVQTPVLIRECGENVFLGILEFIANNRVDELREKLGNLRAEVVAGIQTETATPPEI